MKKLFGWLLLFFGVAFIIWTLYVSWQIFNNQKPAPEIFKPMQIEEIAPAKVPSGLGQLQQQMQEMVSSQLKELIPKDFIPKLFNLIAWSIGAAILILGGGKIAVLGIKLLK